MNMAIEYGQRAKSLEKLQRAGRILRAPAPIRRDCPQGNMGEDDDRRRSWLALDIVREPGELFIAERAHAARFQISDIDEADEMRAAIVKGIPAAALRVLAEAFEIGLAVVFIDEIVLARHIVNIEIGFTDGFFRIVELTRFLTDE